MSKGSRHYERAEELLATLPDIAGRAIATQATAQMAASATLMVLAEAQVHATLAVADLVRDK